MKRKPLIIKAAAERVCESIVNVLTFLDRAHCVLAGHKWDSKARGWRHCNRCRKREFHEKAGK